MIDPLRIAAVQFHSAEFDKVANLARMESFVSGASAKGAHVVSFPEICITGYNWILYTDDDTHLLDVAETVPEGPSATRIIDMAKKHNVAIGFGLLEREVDRLYNTYVVARPDGTWERYRKIHAFENSRMSQGDGHIIFDLFGWTCSTLICFDNNLPENPRICALSGCEILFAPHQTGGFDMDVAGMGRIDRKLWENGGTDPEALRKEFQGPKGREWIVKWLPSRSYDNGMYTIFTNGVGWDHDEVRTGNTMIIDPSGIIQAESTAIDADMIITDLHRDALEGTLGRMHTKTRTPHLYADLTTPSTTSADTRSARNELTKRSRIV